MLHPLKCELLQLQLGLHVHLLSLQASVKNIASDHTFTHHGCGFMARGADTVLLLLFKETFSSVSFCEPKTIRNCYTVVVSHVTPVSKCHLYCPHMELVENKYLFPPFQIVRTCGEVSQKRFMETFIIPFHAY